MLPRLPAPARASSRVARVLRAGAKCLAWMLVLSWSAAGAAFFADRRPLGMPVRGVSAGAVSSTFGAPREGGRRRHRGADIFAARGTPVVAAHSGVVVARATLSLGGRTVATFGRRGVVCYYAHLDRWAPGLAVGDWVREGDVLGTVGNTGNARTTPPHLHFGTYVLWRAGAAVDPVMLLRPSERSSPPPDRK